MAQNSLRMALAALVVTALAATAAPVAAQRAGGGSRIFLLPPVTLAQLAEVQEELKLNDDQKTKAEELQQELVDERGAIFQDAAGDWDYIREEMATLNADISKQLDEVLDEAQRKRLREIYVQVNGPTTLQDPTIVEALELTDEQKATLETAVNDNRQKLFDSFQDFQSMSEEERTTATEELITARDEAYLAVLTDDQKEALEAMKGEALEVDLANLPGFGQ
jgi:hypothetical protein